MNKAMQSLGDVLESSNPPPSSAHPTPPGTAPEEQLRHQSASHTRTSARDKQTWQVNPTTISGKDIEGKVVTLYRDQPRQMSLFQTFIPRDEKYSNTIELYDAVPKYFPVKKVSEIRINDIYLPVVTREFHHKGQSYQVEIRPARITYRNRKTKEKEFYPTYREELIEEALRKIACDNLNGIYLDNAAGVQFTLYELKKELETRGHAINIPDLIEALKICNLTSISIQKDDGKTLMQSPIFPTLLLASKEDWLENPKKVKCYVQFNPLVTASINQITYRQFDYAKYMEYKHRLSRWLHKRLCHNYIQASLFNTYSIRMTTILRDSGTYISEIPSRNVRRIDESLNELKDKDILMRYEKEILRGKRNSIADVKYDLSPSLHFADEMKKANGRVINLEEALKDGRHIPIKSIESS
jgi:hypothetical protein